MRARHRALPLCFAAAALLAAAPSVFACSCVEGTTPTELAEKVDAVFSGRVVSFEDAEVDTKYGRETQRRAVVAVDAVWKGLDDVDEIAHEEVEVFTGRGGGDCGFRFAVGHEYLVYADDIDDRLRTTICARTRLLSLAGPDLRELGDPRALDSLEDVP